MHLYHPAPFGPGYESIVERKGQDADMLMDFGILTLRPGGSWDSGTADEKALLLISGEAELSWKGGSANVARTSLLDESPTALSLCHGDSASITAGRGETVFAVIRTVNPRPFKARLFRPGECRSDERGKGTMRETSTRTVRTIFDDSDASESNLVLGEVVNTPGKWSSYPPHHHPQPEIYHYRFLPQGGFGLTRVGDSAHLLRDGDTVLIREGKVHPQVTAPGYAMWYLWVIRHLEGRRYVTPIFAEEHLWTMESDADIWMPPSERMHSASGPIGGNPK